MKKFLVVYHAPMTEELMQRMAEATPEQQAEGMKAWGDWMEKHGNSIVDIGSPLMNGEMVGHDGAFHISDRHVSGYSILQAEDMEDAKAILENHPHLGAWNPEATVEIHESMPIPGM